MWRDRRCLITGGASFIGSHLVETLVQKGARVRVVDDLSSGRLSHLAAVAQDIEFVEADLMQIEAANRAAEGCEVVFHLAAKHGGRGYIAAHPASCASNMALDHHVFAAAVKQGVDKLVFTSSACVYPTDIQLEKQLLTEDMVSFTRRGGAFADETYGWAKLMGELSLRAYNEQHGIPAAAARLSTAYGPRENESHALVALIAKAFIGQSPFEIWGDGEQTRGFTFVDDIVSGLILIAEQVHDGSALNLGTSDFISLNRVANEIFSILNWRPPLGITYLKEQPMGVRHRALDTTLARDLCGWEAHTPLCQGIQATVDWYVTHHDRGDIADRLHSILISR